MLNIIIKTIPHNHQRYPTCGDYYHEDGINIFSISDMKNEKYEFLVAIHEQIEEFLTRLRGIKEKDITNFDLEFEKNRKDGDYSEPGDNIKAPYYREHQFATIVEKIIAAELKVNWEDYEKAINNLDEPTNPGC